MFLGHTNRSGLLLAKPSTVSGVYYLRPVTSYLYFPIVEYVSFAVVHSSKCHGAFYEARVFNPSDADLSEGNCSWGR